MKSISYETHIKPHTDKILVISMVFLFVLFSVVLATTGVDIYNTSRSSAAHKQLRETTDYVRNELRTCDDDSTIRVATLGGNIPAVVISTPGSSAGEETTEKWIYVFNNCLIEAESTGDATVDVGRGDVIGSMASADFTFVGTDLLEVVLKTPGGLSETVNVYLPGHGGGTDE